MAARVLVVDDDQPTCRMIALGLRGEGLDAAIASSIAQAASVAESFDPQVVLTDLNMTGGTGIDLCRRFADLWPDIPVIVVTAFGSMVAAVEAMRAGAYDFITKTVRHRRPRAGRRARSSAPRFEERGQATARRGGAGGVER